MTEKQSDPIREALAAHKHEIEALAGENLATHVIVAHLCRELIRHDPALREPIAKAFDGAANFVEPVATKHGNGAIPEHTAGTVRIFDQLRDTAIGKNQPRQCV